MRLKECYIEGFGSVRDKKFEFKSGVNCIRGSNGSGKSTLAAFIKAMLYGLGDSKKQRLLENERRHYLPWSGGACKGSLTFCVGDKVYRIERSFGAKPSEDTFILYDVTLGKVSEDYSENLGEELFGIDADGFERTVFLSERQLSPASTNKSISAKLSDLVGCDGDIGMLDEALKALDDKRRDLKKKGGGGEICELEDEILKLKGRLDELAIVEERLAEAEAKERRLTETVKATRAETTLHYKEREAAAVKAARSDYGNRLTEIRARISESIRKKDKLLELFGGTPPSFEEIDTASYKATEARNILESAEGAEYGDAEILANRFDGRCDKGRIEEIKRAVSSIKAKRSLRERPEYTRLASTFSRRIPEEREISEVIATVRDAENKKSSPVAIVLSAIGAALTLGGVILGIITEPLFFAAGAVGALLILLGVLLGRGNVVRTRQRARDELSRLYTSIGDETPPDMLIAPTVLKGLIKLGEKYGELLKSTDVSREEELLRAFVDSFPDEEYSLEAVERIIEEFEKYTKARTEESYIRRDASQRLARAAKNKSECDAFLARFTLSSSEPYTELRNMLTEYMRVSGDIVALRREESGLSSLHSIGELGKTEAQIALERLDEKTGELGERISALERELALAERERRELSEELEDRNSLKLRLDELTEELALKEKNLETVNETKKYLLIAKDNMTGRYLGKTKASFEEYTALISGDGSGEFGMNTDFEITKTEGASTHPTEAYSRGCRDLYSFAQRLALIDSLYEGETPPIILDDPFLSLDDARIRAATKLLTRLGKTRQIIYFTCSESRSV